jgi:hypothetical protein
MLASLPALRSGRRAVAAIAVAAVSIGLGACGDAATAPSAGATSVKGPNGDLVVVSGPPSVAALLTVHVVDINGINLKDSMTVRFSSYAPGVTNVVEVRDNGKGDLDATLGIVKAAITKGVSYKACFAQGTNRYSWGSDPSTYCRSMDTNAFSADLGNLIARRRPLLTWYTKDAFGNLIWPATLAITVGQKTLSVTDGDGINDGGLYGNISFPLYGDVQVSWCETKAPSKYEATTNKCGSFYALWEHDYTYTISHEKLIY